MWVGTGILCKSCQTYIMIEAIPCFLQEYTKIFAPAALCRKQNFTRIKLGPGTYQLFLLPGMQRACTRICICLCLRLKSGKKIRELSIFIIKLRRLINISHYTGVLVLGIRSSFYWLSGVKWFWILSHRRWLGLLTKPTTILSRTGGKGEGGEGNSIVFHLSFLTHSACQCDIT